MKVHDIMTRDVVSCQADADIGAAARLMLEPEVDPGDIYVSGSRSES